MSPDGSDPPAAETGGGPEIMIPSHPRSGSTWLRALLRKNLPDAHVDRTHSLIEDPTADAYIMLMRDPWAWLVRYYDYQLHPVAGWIDKIWNQVLHPPVDEWRASRWWHVYLLFYERWESDLPEDRTVVLHYLDLLPDPRPELEAALETLGIDPPDEWDRERRHRANFRSILGYLPNREHKSSTFDPTYYTEKEYLDVYRPDHMETLYERADDRGITDRYAHFGYDMAEDLP